MVLRTLDIVLLMLCTSCMKHEQEAIRAPTSMAIAVAAVMGYPDRSEVAVFPNDVEERISEVLEARDLKPRFVDATAEFATRRTTSLRVQWLRDHAEGAELLLLVEAEPRYFSQLSGRYRWTVPVTLTLTSRDASELEVSNSSAIPVFLEFLHEKEPQALLGAVPYIERAENLVLDEYLGGM